MNTLTIVLAIVGILAVWFIGVYNGFIRLRNRAKEAWSDIEVQLKRRYDLIPNLVETVKGYATHEKSAFEAVTSARAKALGAGTMKEKAAAEDVLSSALKSVFAIAEAYPQLRAVESFVNLQNELTDTEDKIQAARRFYNGNVRDFNTKIESLPYNFIASLFHFEMMEFFGLEDETAKEPVKVKF